MSARTKISIRNRLFVSITLALVVVFSLLSWVLFSEVKKASYEQIDKDLSEMARLLILEVELQNDTLLHDWLEDLTGDSFRRDRDYIQVFDQTTGASRKSPLLGESSLPKFSAALGEIQLRSIHLPGGKRGRCLGMLIEPVEEDHGGNTRPTSDFPQVFVLAQNIESTHQVLAELLKTIILVGASTTILCAFLIYYIIRISLRPIDHLTSSLQQRSDAELHHPIEVVGAFPSELDEMVHHYNHLLTRIGDVRERERNFSAHAAHELRTPLSGIQATLEQAVSQPRDATEYRQRIQAALSMTFSMTNLVNNLMRFARLRSKVEVTTPIRIDIHEELQNTVAKLSDAIKASSLQCSWSLESESRHRVVDAGLLCIVFSNLIDNAISYSPVGGDVAISTEDHGGTLHVIISNLSSTDLCNDPERLFAPFYRLDPARGQEQHHSGLGLSICQEVAQAIGIQLKLTTQGRVFTAVVEMPAEQKN